MTTRMSMWGVGPKLLVFTLPYVAIAVAAHLGGGDLVRIELVPRSVTTSLAVVLAIGGIALYAATVRTFLPRFRRGELVTSGPFALCRNPLYASAIVLLVPAIGLYLRSWALLSIALVAWAVFKVVIRAEYRALEETFGDEYRAYARRVREIVPVPRFGAQASGEVRGVGESGATSRVR